jgi:hypothetical protein
MRRVRLLSRMVNAGLHPDLRPRRQPHRVVVAGLAPQRHPHPPAPTLAELVADADRWARTITPAQVSQISSPFAPRPAADSEGGTQPCGMNSQEAFSSGSSERVSTYGARKFTASDAS